MPLLVMRQPASSLLDLTCRLVVARQIQYGEERSVPWGVSESAHNVRDVELTYQYSDFGVPGLGLKRGLFEDVVVAPYATALAAMLDPRAALDNFARLEEAGARGVYGFYEALDYTPSNLPEDARLAVVRSYMAHHQGMTPRLAGQRRARRPDPETLPLASDGPGGGAPAPGTDAALGGGDAAPRRRGAGGSARSRPRAPDAAALRIAARHHAPQPSPLQRPLHRDAHGGGLGLQPVERPRAHPLARGHDAGLLGHRSSTCATPRTGEVWSAGFQPSGVEADDYDVVYSEDRAKITQRDRSLAITLEVVVSTEDDAELRQLTVTNLGSRDREIDFTSYAEVVLAPRGRGRGAPRLLEPVRGDGVRPGGRDAAGDATPALGRRAPDLARSRGGDRGRAGGAAAVRERPRALPGPRPRGAVAALRERRRPAVEYGRNGARPHREPPAAARDSARPDGPHRLHDARGAVPRARPSRSRRSTASPAPSSARARWPGRRRRSSSTTCGSARTRRISTSVSPIVCCTPIPRRAWRPRCWPRIGAARPGSGPTASRAIFPSRWCASSGTRSATSCASSCARASTGA